MKIDGQHTRSIWVEDDGWSIGIFDQTLLPHRCVRLRLTCVDDAARAELGISPGTVRLSVGLEDVDDLLEDVAQALKAA